MSAIKGNTSKTETELDLNGKLDQMNDTIKGNKLMIKSLEMDLTSKMESLEDDLNKNIENLETNITATNEILDDVVDRLAAYYQGNHQKLSYYCSVKFIV